LEKNPLKKNPTQRFITAKQRRRKLARTSGYDETQTKQDDKSSPHTNTCLHKTFLLPWKKLFRRESIHTALLFRLFFT